MKKIIVSFFIMAISAYIVLSNNDENGERTAKVDKEISVKKNDFDLTTQKEKTAVLDKFYDIIENDKNEEIYPQALDFSKKQVKCILDKTCTQGENARFYDPKLDPANTILRKSLEVINQITLMDSDKLILIEDNHLLDVLKVEHPSSSFLAYTLLLRKGKDSFKKTFDMAQDLTSDSAINYIRQFKNKVLASDDEFATKRDELVMNYLKTGDHYTVSQLVKELNKHDLSNDMTKSIIDTSCSKLKPFDTEAKNITKLQLKKLSRSINQTSVCQ